MSRDGRTPAIAESTLDKLLATKEIVVFAGSGGVGKTSAAAATAAAAAANLGGKVLVLTVDPARRLADALGVDGIGNVERRIPPEKFKEAGIEPRGELWAAMLDTKQAWDALVLQHTPDEATAYRILENPLYHNITSRFVQSHDYIAMERLYELHQTGKYDLIIIDTPPTRNALDFLEAPKRMADFFGGRLLRWLTAPYRAGQGRGARVFEVAAKPFYQVADRILGGQFLHDIGEFFFNFQTMYDGFVERALAVERLLHDHRTTFAVVSTLEAAPLREAQVFCMELADRGFHLGAIVLNKALPDYFLDEGARTAAGLLAEQPEPPATALSSIGVTALAEVDATARVLRTLGESFQNFEVVAKRETELRTQLAVTAEVVTRIPYFEVDIYDLGGLTRMGSHLFNTTEGEGA
ncbi:MAG TPA: ArsA-related P-loop ATPase [Acidimicrobiia bacterium]|nr:ArsA-related P-loop ATPase [Acidimicrobiia bacterium]